MSHAPDIICTLTVAILGTVVTPTCIMNLLLIIAHVYHYGTACYSPCLTAIFLARTPYPADISTCTSSAVDALPSFSQVASISLRQSML